MRKEKIIPSLVLLVFLASLVSAASVPIKTASPAIAIPVDTPQESAAAIAQAGSSASPAALSSSATKLASSKTARDIIHPKKAKKKNIITKPSITVDTVFRNPISTVLPLPSGDGTCIAPDDDDAIDDVPELLWGDYEPTPAIVDEDFAIRVCAVDDVGVDRIRVRLNSYYDAEMDCGGARQCVRTFIVSQPTSGTVDYRVYAYDTMDNSYLDTLPVVVNLPACDDEDADGMCDMDENPACVGENLANMPADTSCLQYTLELGCHVAQYDDGTAICDASAGSAYACVDGTDVGDDVYQRTRQRYCGIGTGMCDGAFESVGDFTVADTCDMQTACAEGEPECQPRLLPPIIEPIGDRTVAEGETILINVDATDPNEDTLDYTVDAPFGEIDSVMGIFTYTTEPGDAGEYTLTFSVTDGSFLESETITVTITDTAPPSITAVEITPDTAYTTTLLTCTPSGWSSSLGASPSYRYRWLDNGEEIAGETANTFNCDTVSGCDKHDEITCAVTPFDANGEGTPRTDSVTILNSPPSMSSSSIFPALPGPVDTTDDLGCYCGIIVDADAGDPLDCSFTEISRNSVVHATGTDEVILPASVTARGDVVTCGARATDDEEETPIASSSLTIGNALPAITSVTAWGWTDSAAPFSFTTYINEESLLDIDTSDPDPGDSATVTCSAQDAYEVSECSYNFDDVISGSKPVECDSHPDSGCFGITDNAGPLTINVHANDGLGESVTAVGVDVRLRYYPPSISTSNIEVTEGDPVTCPCTGLDPDGGSITERYCTEPFDGPGDLTDYYTALYADVGRTFEGVCTLTDDEGNRASAGYTIQVNGARYDITLRSRIRDGSSLISDETKPIEDFTTRLLIEDNELWQYIGSGPVCTSAFCGNTPYLVTINDYFDNFRSDLSEPEQLSIYGSDWELYMDNGGIGDTNHEVTFVSFDITRI